MPEVTIRYKVQLVETGDIPEVTVYSLYKKEVNLCKHTV
jgi:hypothetical protein